MVDQANVTQDVKDAFAKVTHKDYRWVIAKVNGSTVELVKFGERSTGLEELRAELGDSPVYIVYDFEATRGDSSTLCKTCFICYAPDTCTVMAEKFALQNFKASTMACINHHKELQINDKADLSDSEFRSAFGLND